MAEAHGSSSDGAGTNMKESVASFLENHWVESFVVLLVLADVALVTIEAGVDADLLCIGGKRVPFGSPAGEHLPLGHGHGLLQVVAAGEETLTSAAMRVATHMADLGRVSLPIIAGLLWSRSDEAVSAGAVQTRSHSRRGSLAQVLAPDSAVSFIKPHHHEETHTGGRAEADAHNGVADAHGHHQPPDVLVCEGPEGHRVHHLVHTCHFWSIAILTVFAIELILKLWAIPGFLDNVFHKLDMFVVFLSLLIDTVVMWYIDHAMDATKEESRHRKEEAEIITGLLLLSRVWRIVRIAHGLYEFQEKQAEEAIERALHSRGDVSEP